jgi:SAM-dependent methyltransferase
VGDNYLKTLKDAGWDTYGIDIDVRAVENAKKLGLNVFVEEVYEANFPNEYFDIIVMKHALEHIHNPSKTLNEAYRILKKDGILIAGVPNIESLEFELFREYWHQIDAPRHLYHFSQTSFGLLLQKCGFIIDQIVYENVSYPFIRSINYWTNKKFEKMLTNQLFFGLMYPLTAFIARVLKKGTSLVVYARISFNARLMTTRKKR